MSPRYSNSAAPRMSIDVPRPHIGIWGEERTTTRGCLSPQLLSPLQPDHHHWNMPTWPLGHPAELTDIFSPQWPSQDKSGIEGSCLTNPHSFFAGIGHNRVWASLVPWVAQRKRFCEAEAVWPLSILGVRGCSFSPSAGAWEGCPSLTHLTFTGQ